MRILLQRVTRARVDLAGRAGDEAGPGLLALVGFRTGDGAELLRPMASKMTHLRIFADAEGRMNRSLLDSGASLVVVSQFTLYADCRKGRRPGYSDALEPRRAAALFEEFATVCREVAPEVILGTFGADMQVHLTNDGPVTILLDSAELGLGGRTAGSTAPAPAPAG